MIKDIVVNLNVGAEANWASDYAISVASELDAQPDRDRFALWSNHADLARRLRSPQLEVLAVSARGK